MKNQLGALKGITDTNVLHARIYGEGNQRKFPKKRVLTNQKDLKAAAKWLNKRQSNEV